MFYSLGLNSSTQSLSGVVISSDGREVYRSSVNYEQQLGGRYGVREGFLDTGLGEVYTSPLLLAHALDLFFADLQANVKELSRIRVISGAAQQHGTVYLNDRARSVLSGLDPLRPLHVQLPGIFSRPLSPIWRDSSTAREVQELSEFAGGDAVIARITGSVPTRRFSLPQIMKFAREERERYERTAHILLISAFCCSLLIGGIAPEDFGDASGKNLLDLSAHRWSPEILTALRYVCPALSAKLPAAVSSLSAAGTLAPYWAKRYGLSEECRVMVFSGDNNDSLLGTGVVEPGEMVHSFGTSDTSFALTDAAYDPAGFGHVFAAVSGGNFGMSVHSNGALTRRAVGDRFQLDWAGFSESLHRTPPGNRGRGMLPFLAPEITPLVRGGKERYFGGLEPADRDGCIRAIVEAQLLNRQEYARWLGPAPKVIRATGGAAQSRDILQIGADIFDACYVVFESPDSVSLGAAMRGLKQSEPEISWNDLAAVFCRPAGDPIEPRNPAAYEELRAQFREQLALFLGTI